MTIQEQVRDEGRTLLRISHELREFFQGAASEPEGKSLLADIDVIERVGQWLSSVTPIGTSVGIPAAGSAILPSKGTARPISDNNS